MATKSHVSMERKKCAVCGRDFETNAILLDRRLRNTLERYTLTGWGLCPEHQALYDKGYIALVGADESKSDKKLDGSITVEGAWRTGDVAHVKFELFDKIVNIKGTDKAGNRLPMMFCDPSVIQMIAGKQPTDERP